MQSIGVGNMYCLASCTMHLCCCGEGKGQFTAVCLICDF